jgi:hypothetical protein
MQVLNSTAPSGGTGSFDVILKEVSGGPDGVSTDNVALSIPSGTGVSFTGADGNTNGISEPYIYGAVLSSPFSSPGFPNVAFQAGDSTLTTLPFQVTINSGDVFGLAHVTYAVAPGTAAKVVNVSLGSNCSLEDVSSIADSFTKTNGTITVTAVPEPASAGLLAVGGAVLLQRRRRRLA